MYTGPFYPLRHLITELIQYHSKTPRGTELLRNFAVDICGAKPNWIMNDFLEQEITRIRTLVGDKAQVLGAVSGVGFSAAPSFYAEFVSKCVTGSRQHSGGRADEDCYWYLDPNSHPE